MTDIASMLRRAAVFAPELNPLIPDLMAAFDTAEKLEPAMAPIIARVEKGESVLIEGVEAVGAINANLPAIAHAFATFAKLRALAALYQARLEAASK